MIASCWDWSALKFAYFVIDGAPLDAGGWSPTRGILAASKDAPRDSTASIAFDECLPTLPKNCYFAGAGDFCVGELFEKRDADRRPELDMARIKAQGTPDMLKVVELLEGRDSSAVASLRGAVRSNPPSLGSPTQRLSANSYRPKSLWSMLVPTFSALGTGYAMYRFLGSGEGSSLSVTNIVFAWAAGLAVGVSVGQEYARQPSVREPNGE